MRERAWVEDISWLREEVGGPLIWLTRNHPDTVCCNCGMEITAALMRFLGFFYIPYIQINDALMQILQIKHITLSCPSFKTLKAGHNKTQMIYMIIDMSLSIHVLMCLLFPVLTTYIHVNLHILSQTHISRDAVFRPVSWQVK